MSFSQLKIRLRAEPQKWLVTGAAGFIGSHLVEALLSLDQDVVGLDNLSTGHRHNLDDVKSRVSASQWARFRFQEGDITRLEDCHKACAGAQRVLHQAALGSVPRSLADPLRSHANNVDGFINMLVAAREAKVSRLVYASSSSVYGDHPDLPKVEANIGRPLSPYAATKLINEVYAGVFSRSYGLSLIGLRYFNVFGPRQDPKGAYAAVIPKWFDAAAKGAPVVINGDGETSRDFCYIANVVQANLLAAAQVSADGPQVSGLKSPSVAKPMEGRQVSLLRPAYGGQAAPSTQVSGFTSQLSPAVYNVAAGRRTTLNELFEKIRVRVARKHPATAKFKPTYQPERAGDVRHSLADISLIQTQLGYVPTHDIDQGLDEAAEWYVGRKT